KRHLVSNAPLSANDCGLSAALLNLRVQGCVELRNRQRLLLLRRLLRARIAGQLRGLLLPLSGRLGVHLNDVEQVREHVAVTRPAEVLAPLLSSALELGDGHGLLGQPLDEGEHKRRRDLALHHGGDQFNKVAVVVEGEIRVDGVAVLVDQSSEVEASPVLLSPAQDMNVSMRMAMSPLAAATSRRPCAGVAATFVMSSVRTFSIDSSSTSSSETFVTLARSSLGRRSGLGRTTGSLPSSRSMVGGANRLSAAGRMSLRVIAMAGLSG